MGPVEAAYYDGQSAARQQVQVSATSDARSLMIQPARRSALVWPLSDLRAVETAADRLVVTLHRAGEPAEARLILTDPALVAWITAAAPDLHRRDVAAGTVPKVALRVAAALGAVALILFVLLPAISDRLAAALPRDQEVAFGKAVVRQMSEFFGDGQAVRVCDTAIGVAALDRMVTRLTDGQGLGYDLQVVVIDSPIVNAFAAPGGHVVILRGLLDEAQSPDEVAGVLAHEIGHVEARDATRLAFRAAGSAGILSLLFGDVSGGAAITLAGNHLMNAAYTREAESAADAFALRLLSGARIGTAGFADFFDRIDGMDGDLPAYLSTHPESALRAAQARSSGMAGTPALTDSQWQALRAICG